MTDEDAIKILGEMERYFVRHGEMDSRNAQAVRWALDRAAQPTVDEIANLLAKELPEGYTVELTLGKGEGSVEVENWNDTTDEPDFDDTGSIGEQLLNALVACKDHAVNQQ